MHFTYKYIYQNVLKTLVPVYKHIKFIFVKLINILFAEITYYD